jgi:hypothetical protein
MLWEVILVAAGVLSLLAVPLLSGREPWSLNETPDRLRQLKRVRDRSMRTLKDLENEFREGSLSSADYEELRAAYKLEAIAATRELSRVRDTLIRQISAGPGRPLSSTERETLERLVAQRARKYSTEK